MGVRTSRGVKRVTDPVSFAIGLLFVAASGGVSLAGVEMPDGGLRWLGAVILGTLGSVLLVGSKARD